MDIHTELKRVMLSVPLSAAMHRKLRLVSVQRSTPMTELIRPHIEKLIEKLDAETLRYA